MISRVPFEGPRATMFLLVLAAGLALAVSAKAVILWNDPDTTRVHENGAGNDILGGAVKRDDSANDTLYFKFHLDPLSDKDTEEYFAAFELFEGNAERLGVGNALKAWAYSAFYHPEGAAESNSVAAYIDLHSSKPEFPASSSSGTYQLPRRGKDVTIVFKVQYIPGEDDLVTIWLNPDLGPGANEASQAESLTTKFNAKATFDEIRLRHSGSGGGWSFSDLAIATSFTDFVDLSSSRPAEPASDLAIGTRSLSFQSWQKEQGLPQSPVRALAQTQDGYIWLGTDDGLVRFDGLRFATFGTAGTLNGHPITVLLEDHRGALWIGTADGGLICWYDDRFSKFTTREGLPANSISALTEDGSGRLWIGTDCGLAVCENGRVSTLPPAQAFKGLPISALCRDRKETVWMGVKGAGVFHFSNDHFVELTDDSVADSLKDTHCLLIDRANRVWLGAGEDFVLCQENGKWHRYRIPPHQAKSSVTALTEEADGTVWAGSLSGGLLQFKDGKFAALPAGTGLAGNLIQSILTDREGHLWIGTEAGLNRLRRKALIALSQPEGLGFGAAQGLAEVMPGIVWVAKANNGLYRWDGRSFSRLSAAALSGKDSQITTLLVSRSGYCWVATTNSLLLYKDPVAAADEVRIIRESKGNIISLAEDGEGALWAGTREGKLWCLREERWLAQTNFSQTKAVTALVCDPNGSVWIGTDGNGLFELSNGKLKHFEPESGLPGKFIRSLFVDTRETLWIGSADSGLRCRRNGSSTNFTTREGLPDNNISQIVEDDLGRLWLGSGSGIACINKSEMEDVAARKVARLYPQVFRRTEGMLSEECIGGFCPAGLKTKSGQLWFSTSKGVAVVSPRLVPATAPAPNAIVEEILVDGTPALKARGPEPLSRKLQADALRIRPGRHQVAFRFTGISFNAPESICFRYRLEGLDPDWVDAGTRRSAFYSYLPPGDYHFDVAACNSGGSWSESQSNLRLTVSRHFWQTWWFFTLASLGSVGSVILAVHIAERRKLHRRLKHIEEERALEQERTRIAKDLHDEMGAKLCRISFLSEHARRNQLPPEELREQITSISDASRELLHSLDEIVWAVNPQNDTLEHVASYIGQYAQEYFQMTGIQCELDIPVQLPSHSLSSQMRHHLFLATHEALTNILKHSGATRAGIWMVSGKTGFEIKISDNGKGLNSNLPRAKSNSPTTSSGDGLHNMRKRLTDIGGHCTIESSPGQGTNITFSIPLNSLTNGH